MASYKRPINQTPTFNASNYTFQNEYITSRLYWLYFAPTTTTTIPTVLGENNEFYSGSSGTPYARIFLNSSNGSTLSVPTITATLPPDMYTNLYFPNTQILTDATGVRITQEGRSTPFLSATTSNIPTLSGLAIQPDFASFNDIYTPSLETKMNLWGVIMGGNNNGRQTHSCQITASIHRHNSLNLVGMTDGPSDFNRKINVWGEAGFNITGGLRLNTTTDGRADRLTRVVYHAQTATQNIDLPASFLGFEFFLAGKIRIFVDCLTSSTTVAGMFYHIQPNFNQTPTGIRLKILSTFILQTVDTVRVLGFHYD